MKEWLFIPIEWFFRLPEWVIALILISVLSIGVTLMVYGFIGGLTEAIGEACHE